MATARTSRVHYKSLNSLSSVVLYDTGKKPRGKYYEVERIIERRKVEKRDYKYLVKWARWPLQFCSWEPSDHLTSTLLRTYDNPPKPDAYRMEQAGRNFAQAILISLKGKSVSPADAAMDLDIYRYIFRGKGTDCEHKGHSLYHKDNFERFYTLPSTWWYCLDLHGQGRAVNFPIKLKPVLSWTAPHFIVENKELKQAKRTPIEKVRMYVPRQAYSPVL